MDPRRRLGEWLLRHRVAVLAVIGLLTAFFAYEAAHLRVGTAVGARVPRDHEDRAAHDRLAADFGGDNELVIMLEVPGGSIFTADTLNRLRELTAGLARVPGVDPGRIESIAHPTVRVVKAAAGGTLRAQPVMAGPVRTAADAAAVRRSVHEAENVYGVLVSRDDTAALVRARFTTEALDYGRVVAAIDALVAAAEGTPAPPLPHHSRERDGVREPLGHLDRNGIRHAASAALGLQDSVPAPSPSPAKVRERESRRPPAASHSEPSGAVTVDPATRGSQAPARAETTGAVRISVVGTAWRYGAVYRHARASLLIGAAAVLVVWLSLFRHFRDWRGVLGPTVSAAVAATWGLGGMRVAGLELDPLLLLLPVVLTARAVSHAVQMYDRYGEAVGDGRERAPAIVAAFVAHVGPACTGIVADALGVLAMLVVPVVLVQRVALAGSFWIASVLVAELLVTPLVLSYLPLPRRTGRRWRDRGRLLRAVEACTAAVLSATGRRLTLALALLLVAAAALAWHRAGAAGTASSSLLAFADAPAAAAARNVRDRFGGVAPFVVLAEGYDRGAMQDPATLRAMERLQRHLERDRAVGYSVSLADTVRTVNTVFHELEPKWGVIPNGAAEVESLLAVYFSGAPAAETALYVDPTYTVAPVTIFCADGSNAAIRRIAGESAAFLAGALVRDLGLTVAGRGDAVVVTAVDATPVWEKADTVWVVGARAGSEPPFVPGDRIVSVGRTAVGTVPAFEGGLTAAARRSARLDFTVVRDGEARSVTVMAPWKAVFRVAGGDVGVAAAAQAVVARDHLRMVAAGLCVIAVVLLVTYRSFAAALCLLVPLLVANAAVVAYLGARGIGLTIDALPLVAVGVGFGIDAAIYIVRRIVEEHTAHGDLEDAVRRALVTAGGAVTVGGGSMAAAALLWAVSPVRFDAEMGLLLAVWMAASAVASLTVLPAVILMAGPRFAGPGSGG